MGPASLARRPDGEKVVGKKIGAPARRCRTCLGVHQPDFGRTDWMHHNGEDMPMAGAIQPRAEGGDCLHPGRQSQRPGRHPADVIAATECRGPCFEIVDSRSKTGRSIIDTIADNASCGCSHGDGRVDPRRLDLPAPRRRSPRTRPVSEGYGTRVTRDPGGLAGQYAGRPWVSPDAGDVILSGLVLV